MKPVVRTFLFAFAVCVIAALSSQPALGQYKASSKSDKFHKETCRYVKQIKAENLIEFKTIKEAEYKGYIPCKVCKPTSSVEDSSSSSSTDDVADTRCQATTKKGTQCKRDAEQGSRYCWQHQ